MGKAARIRRMQQRAQERGDTYEPSEKLLTLLLPSNITEEDETKYIIAKTLKSELDKIEKNVNGLNSKEKRASKRKAEAIALEEVNRNKDDDEDKISNVNDILTWYTKNQSRLSAHMKKKKKDSIVNNTIKDEDQKKLNAYNTYKLTMSQIEDNNDLNAKDRRSAKRKADAIACEESAFTTIQELCDWYDSNHELQQLNIQKQDNDKKKTKKTNGMDLDGGSEKKSNPYPYILFIGQIPYTATEDDIYKHFQKFVGKKEINKQSMKIRIPQDQSKKGKDDKKQQQNQKQQEIDFTEMGVEELCDEEYLDYSNESGQVKSVSSENKCRGFAFAEFNDPKLMFECLKLHHTDLNGRRINVIRGVGGGKEARKQKHEKLKKEQDEYISATVDKIINEYIDRGELQEGELDEGAVLLCKRRSAATVHAALSTYIEQRADKNLENPSSFFTKVICDVTEEGQAGTQSTNKNKRKMSDNSRQSKKPRSQRSNNPKSNKNNDMFGESSIFNKAGVDMSLSHKSDGEGSALTSIFPSMSRGRGRGRGAYM